MEYNKKEALKWLKNLLSFDSVESEPAEGAPFGEGARQSLDYALKMMRDKGFTTKDVEGYCGYGETGEGELFGILCHLDVVPVGEGWTYPPFGAEIHDNKMYARGALDDKGPFIAIFCAVNKLLEEGYKPSKRIRFILGCDEESGWKCMDRYKLTEEIPSIGISPDGDFPVIYCEKGIVYHSIYIPLQEGIERLESGLRPNMVPSKASCKVAATRRLLDAVRSSKCSYLLEGKSLVITTVGKSAHGSHPEEGDNALIKLLNILGEEYSLLKSIAHAFGHSDGSDVELKREERESGALTLNLGTARIEDGRIKLDLDIRHPIDVEKDEITEILREKLPFAEIRQDFFHLPLYVPKDHYLVKTLLSAYNKVTGENASPISIGGGTYARVLPLGVAFGPEFPKSKAGIHCVDEYLDLEEFDKCVEIYYEAMKELCFAKK